MAIRAISTTANMPGPSGNPYSSGIPAADSFQLLSESQKTGEAEDALYEAQIKEVEAWWSSPRYSGIQRPYCAADIVTKRGTQKILYPSSVMASKLFNLIQERLAKGEPIHTSRSSWIFG
jgi:isocitrate lyase